MRLFVAIDPPADVRAALARLQEGVPGARWLAPETLHLTIRFIGEVGGGGVRDIAAALSRIDMPSFDLAIEGVGHFETGRRPHALWAGVAPSEPLARLRRKVESALGEAGVAPDDRKFTPHVTLARLKDAKPGRIRDFLTHHALFRAPPFRVEGFTLFSSLLSKSGAIHRPELEVLFSDAELPDDETSEDLPQLFAGRNSF